jgi:hypothetical protein
MDEYRSLNHTKWDCKYHVVFIPKCLYRFHDERRDEALRLGLEGPHESRCAIARHCARQRVHFCDGELEKHCAAF